MNPNPEFLIALASAAAPGAAPISLADALLVLALAGLLLAAYQLNRVVLRLDALEARLNALRARREDAAPTAVIGQPAGDSLPPEVVAAIAAACQVTLGLPVRIASIKDAADAKQVWPGKGRR